jgi:cell wall-associated NlpC family hydrolase
MHIPLGSSLDGMKKGRLWWNKTVIRYKGKLVRPGKKKLDVRELEKLAFVFLNTPYLWGGKSVFGADCSGFTQTVFRFVDIPLLRDAWQQATMGEEVNSLKTVRRGDLAFFDNADGKITHVGIILNNKKIIHASGKVRVDKLMEEGIINGDTKQLTHRLKLIRRFF